MLIGIRPGGKLTFVPFALGSHFEKGLTCKMTYQQHAFIKISLNGVTGAVVYAEQF